MQQAGVNLLSIAYALKAVVFIIQSNLVDTNYRVLSPLFGIKIDSNSKLVSMYGIGDGEIETYQAGLNLTLRDKALTVFDGNVGVKSAFSKITGAGLSISNGLILGRCVKHGAANNFAGLQLRSKASYNTILYAKIATGRTASASLLSVSKYCLIMHSIILSKFGQSIVIAMH